MIDAADFLKWLEVFNVQFGSSVIPIPVPISYGGTGVTSVTTAPTISMWAGWDAHKNLSANSFILGYATTPTAATTTTLTVSSAYLQFFTGSTTQNVVMPVVSTLVLGQPYKIVNNSSGSVTVKSSGGNTIQVMLANTSLLLTCVAITGTTETSWDSEYFIDSSLALPLSLASGGTNANLTANAGGVVWSDSTKFNILDGTLTPNQILMSGITDAPAWSTASYPPTTTINQLLYSSADNVIGGLATLVNGVLVTNNSGVPSLLANSGTPGYVLTANAGAPPSWQNITAEGAVTQVNSDSGNITPTSGIITISGGTTGLTSSGSVSTLDLTGILNLSHGGSNANLTADNGGIVYSTATAMAILAGTATAGQILRSGATGAPSWSTATYPATAGTSGNILQSDGTNWLSAAVAGIGSPLTTKGDLYTFSTVNARLAVGTTNGQILQVASGAATGLAYSTPAYPSTSGTSGKVIISDGTNNVYSTSTFPTSAGATAGKALVSDGTNYVLSSFAFPTSVGGTGTLLRSDGTNWVATTTTYPNTNAINTLLFASSANVMSALATANSSGLLTDGSGVPAWVTVTGTGAPVLGTAPTISAPKINQINDQSQNLPALSFTGTASAVNYVDVKSNITGNGPYISSVGTDTNIDLNYLAKGTGGHVFVQRSTVVAFTMTSVATGVNYIGSSGSATGVAPSLNSTGTDSNVSMTLSSKGTGRVQIQGISTNTAAAAGYVGEFITSNVPLSSAVSLSNSTSTDVTSISLTAGDWDVSGSVSIAYGTSGQIAEMWISSSSATPPDPSVKGGQLNLSVSNITAYVASSPSQRFLLSTTTTIYLSCFSTFTGTATACGSIYARRRS